MTLDGLLTADESILLDTVDKLRNHGVSKYIKLPQIIVCGDQSSGKSSVLEAISRISFPRGRGICTTFPTELALRRDPNRTVKVQLKPSASRPESERISLSSYQPPTGRLEDFEPLVRNAQEHLKKSAGKDRGADSFFEDTLHVEVTDPKWPPLSLVDLPGLISSPNPEQTAEDVPLIYNMVSNYMMNPKSIILAVISAGYELPLQKVFSIINKYDPLGKRTICVVTKPDSAVPGPDDLPQFVQYAQNSLPGYTFELGWHVVMNRAHNAQTQTSDERDKAEKDFFAQAPWSGRLHRDQLGINKLRDRLSTLLERHTRAEMPGVLKQISETLNASRDELSKLGPARSNSDEQRKHLTTIGQRFENLVRQSMNGYYDDSSFFLPELPESDPRKLRAAVQNLNEDFAKRMHERGHTKQIMAEGITELGIFQRRSTSTSPEKVLRSEYIQYIKSLSRKNRGVELIGSPNLRLVRDLFLDQSRAWRPLATDHLENVVQIVIDHLSAVSGNVASPETAAALRREVVYQAVDTRRKRVMEKLEELMKSHEKGHPITYDLSYVENSRKLVKADVKLRLENYQRRNIQKSQNSTVDGTPSAPQGLQIHQVIDALKLDAEQIEEVDCADILNSMQAYYEGALRTFIDNVAVLAVEGCLIDDLDKVFSPTEVVKMDEQKLHALGGESKQAVAERFELKQKVAALEDAQRECLRAGVIHERQSYSPATTTTKTTGPVRTEAQSPMIFRTPIPAYSSNPFAFQKPAFESFKPVATSGKSIFSESSPPSIPTSETPKESEELGSTPKRGDSTALPRRPISALTPEGTIPPFEGDRSTSAFANSTWSSSFVTGVNNSSPGNIPPLRSPQKPTVWSTLQNASQTGGSDIGGSAQSLSQFKALPIYLNDFMSFEELQLFDRDSVGKSNRLDRLREKLNENQPSGTGLTALECPRLVTM